MIAVLDATEKIHLLTGETMLVSAQDAVFARKHKWRATSGTRKYARSHFAGQYHHFHRFVLGLDRGDKSVVDHINGDPLDNRRENLRICTYAENRWNQRKTNSRLGLYGVTHDAQTNMFIGKFTHNGKVEYLGYFGTSVEAAHAYNRRAATLRGEYAVLNDIDPVELRSAISIRIAALRQEIERLETEIKP